MNRLICGDNIDELAKLPKESFDLVYADPPFFSNRHYEVIWGDEAEVRSFEDRWEGGIEHYISWMKPRIQLVYEVLKTTGCFCLHCDWHADAHLRILTDSIFGAENFQNELIWQRAAAKGDVRRKFGANHDMLLIYSKADKYVFHSQYSEETEAYTDRFNLNDNDGRGPYRLAPLDSPNPRIRLTYSYKDYPPPANGWRVSLAVMERLDAEGRLAFPKTKTGRIAKKHYLKEQKGPKLGSVWADIVPLQANDKEQQGYPTQKPRKLLRRIIAAMTDDGAWVLDPFCGCGTAALAAQELGRNWVGIDISPTAIKTIEKQLAVLKLQKGTDYIMVGLPTTSEALHKLQPFEFQNWVIDELRGWHSRKKTGDMGIDGEIHKDLFRSAAGIQVKQSADIGRNVVDNFETALKRAGHKKGYLVALSFGKGAYEEAARVRNSGELTVVLLPVEKLLDKEFSLADFEEPESPPVRKPEQKKIEL